MNTYKLINSKKYFQDYDEILKQFKNYGKLSFPQVIEKKQTFITQSDENKKNQNNNKIHLTQCATENLKNNRSGSVKNGNKKEIKLKKKLKRRRDEPNHTLNERKNKKRKFDLLSMLQPQPANTHDSLALIRFKELLRAELAGNRK